MSIQCMHRHKCDICGENDHDANECNFIVGLSTLVKVRR